MRNTILFATVVLLLIVAPVVFSANIWQDDFSSAQMNAKYKTPASGNGKNPPKWVQEGGVMKQTEPKPGDPTYLAVEVSKDISFCGQLVRIRFDQ